MKVFPLACPAQGLVQFDKRTLGETAVLICRVADCKNSCFMMLISDYRVKDGQGKIFLEDVTAKDLQ